MNTLASSLTQVLTPDFYDYEPYPLSSVVCEGGFVHVLWPDDTKMECYKFWLRENAVGQGGVDLATRECVLDPADLTDDIDVKSAVVDNAGNLIVEWAHDGQRSVYHSGWLRHIAKTIIDPVVGCPRLSLGRQAPSVRCRASMVRQR
jgi:gamma-butyrobetaine dioxygenase